MKTICLGAFAGDNILGCMDLRSRGQMMDAGSICCGVCIRVDSNCLSSNTGDLAWSGLEDSEALRTEAFLADCRVLDRSYRVSIDMVRSRTKSSNLDLSQVIKDDFRPIDFSDAGVFSSRGLFDDCHNGSASARISLMVDITLPTSSLSPALLMDSSISGDCEGSDHSKPQETNRSF